MQQDAEMYYRVFDFVGMKSSEEGIEGGKRKK
jgi:hypothetical protein